jgi:hypothetical protein
MTHTSIATSATYIATYDKPIVQTRLVAAVKQATDTVGEVKKGGVLEILVEVFLQ